jgi:hypothetical protein
MALINCIVELCKPVKGTWRVVMSRWGLYVFAMVPGLFVLTGELNDSVGLRPYFQNLQLPLDIVDVRLLAAELFGGGTAILMLGVAVIWVLQLVWLGGATLLFNSANGQANDHVNNRAKQKLFRPGWQFLGRYVRIAIFSLIVVVAAHMGIKSLFAMLSARSEIEDWALQTSMIGLNVWRVGLLFVALTLIGTFAFWIRMITVAENRRDLRRLPMMVIRLFLRRPVAALLFQFAAIALVLSLQAVALVCWRQSSGGLLWPLLWAVTLFFASWVWQVRIRAALGVLKSIE